MRYAVYPISGGGFFRWRLIDSNGRRIATSDEYFYSQSNAMAAASRFKSRCSSWTYEVYGDLMGIYRWRAMSTDNKIVALSGESFSSQFGARGAVSNVQVNGGSASGP